MIAPVGILEAAGHHADAVPALRFALLLDLLEATRDGGDVRRFLERVAQLDATTAAASEPER